jgi:hypothetical protein
MDGIEVKLTGMEKMLQRVCKFIGSPNVPKTAGEFNLPVAPQATMTTTEERGQMKEGSATSTSTVWKIAPESNSPPSFRSILREEHAEAQREAERAMRRKRNIILYKLAELESDSWDDRREHNGEVIGRLMNTLEQRLDVVDFNRLGNRYAASKNDKAVMTVQTERPLLVTLRDEDQSHKVLSSLNKLCNAANDI